MNLRQYYGGQTARAARLWVSTAKNIARAITIKSTRCGEPSGKDMGSKRQDYGFCRILLLLLLVVFVVVVGGDNCDCPEKRSLNWKRTVPGFWAGAAEAPFQLRSRLVGTYFRRRRSPGGIYHGLHCEPAFGAGSMYECRDPTTRKDPPAWSTPTAALTAQTNGLRSH